MSSKFGALFFFEHQFLLKVLAKFWSFFMDESGQNEANGVELEP
jgi:hypothetical protein